MDLETTAKVAASNVLDQATGSTLAKAAWKSKTLWAGAIAAILPLVFPPAAVWVSANPELFSAALGAVFSILRLATKEKVAIK